ncbi:hypothetical protein LRB11_07565 [Ectothiorhodospira haloalkaliphila]|uniref:hypothetical protein n=1 Tax=Ectothiorhodospira haloalkaliphila TaxID=421628 RepID=UPI001EE7C111|nr:hypothetical protein [Ectothiorhodospira haloalkaliphila]MCG5524784.1 hypothetical protein [Ectothiorhodospira haloalkaliphila]
MNNQHLVPKALMAKADTACASARVLNRAHEIRLVADYNGSSVEAADAKNIVEQAEAFVTTMRARFMTEG